jgi:outer membrane receptor protein involved in Fe transport
VGNVLASHVSRVIYIQSGLPGVLPDAAQPGYWLANLRLGVRTSDDKWGFSFYADNIFNKAYFVYGSSSSSTGNQYNWGKPRVMGGEIDVKF